MSAGPKRAFPLIRLALFRRTRDWGKLTFLRPRNLDHSRTMQMYSAEQRAKAIETFARFGCSAADTVAKLGYSDRVMLRN